MKYFHFTIGPVQGFVSQARRTRDFWAGSFILSWLSAVAMRAVQQQGGNVVFPKPDAKFMEAIRKGGKGPKQGSIPNRFMAEVDDKFEATEVVDAVKMAWTVLSEKVWEHDLHRLENNKTKIIWNRQISAFWDIEWAIVKNKDATNTLDRLKNMRSHLPPDEPGVKCMMMDGWQELSGTERPGKKGNSFWDNVRELGQDGIKTDLRPGEKLCAIAFVKRRFSRCFKDVSEKMPGNWMVNGWELPSGVPSVHYMAVAPWLAQLIEKANENEEVSTGLWDFHNAAHKLTGNYGEWKSNIRCVQDADGHKQWKALDGTVFFDAMLENKNLWDKQEKQATEVLSKLKKVRGEAKLDPPSPFYTVLLMDGDELGLQMRVPDKQQAIATGLAEFTKEIPSIVNKHNGFLIYAGGDDVLVLLPLEDALNCAAALRRHYMGCFATSAIITSISAAIEYAHAKMPLGKVLLDAHDLLDKVAKEGRGRDALACRVWKPGGMTVEWAQPWQIALEDCNVVVERLAADFQKNDQSEGKQGHFSSKFFYRIRERFDLLNPGKDKEKELLEPVLKDEQAISLMAMVKSMEEARVIVKQLLEQCRPRVRDKTKTIDAWESKHLEADGALLVRFLAKKGVER